MSNQLFRKKSMDKVSSPEQLNDYIRVSNPGAWMVLVGILVFLTGVCVWAVFGRLDTTIQATAVSNNGVVTCYVKEADQKSVKEGMTVQVDGRELTIDKIAKNPVTVDQTFDTYLLHLGGLQTGEWVYEASLQGKLEEGTYKAEIVAERISPMHFIMN